MATSHPSSKPGLGTRHKSDWGASGLGSKRKYSTSEEEEEDVSGCSDEELELAITSRYSSALHIPTV